MPFPTILHPVSAILPPASDPAAYKTIDYGLAPGAIDENIDVQSEEMRVNMGPQHPASTISRR